MSRSTRLRAGDGTPDAPRALPHAVARLVQAQKNIDIRADLVELLERGQRRVTIGIGGSVDIPLLNQELHAAEIAMLDREVIIAAVRVETDGYVIERGWSNFGVYVWTDAIPAWQSVPWMGAISGLMPGDKVALGSAPAEALRFDLPESALVPAPLHPRDAAAGTRWPPSPQTDRGGQGPTNVPPYATPPALTRDPWAGISPAVQQRRRTVDGSPSGGGVAQPLAGVNATRTPSGSSGSLSEGGLGPSGGDGRPMPLRPDADKYQRRFDVAFKHWRYDKIDFGDLRAVIPLDEAELQGMRVAIGRNLEHPERGYDVFVKEPLPEFWVQPVGEQVRLTRRGDVIRLRGAGNRIGFAGFEVLLPEPAVPVPRFAPRAIPSSAEIAEVLGVPVERLSDLEWVKAAYRDLVQRFHPDMHDGDLGHLSRYLEIQTCFEALKRTRPST